MSTSGPFASRCQRACLCMNRNTTSRIFVARAIFAFAFGVMMCPDLLRGPDTSLLPAHKASPRPILNCVRARRVRTLLEEFPEFLQGEARAALQRSLTAHWVGAKVLILYP